MKSRNTSPQYIFKIPSWWTVRYFLYVRLALQICNVANWQILSYNVKKCIILLKRLGISLENCTYDAMIAAYLLCYKIEDYITLIMNQLENDIIDSY